jgi:hypothetical protein
MNPVIRLHPILAKYDEFSSSSIISPLSNSFLNEHNQSSLQQQLEIYGLVLIL